jgi:hypothetical protein
VSTDPLASPVVVDGVVSDEKLSELLALQAEYPELDYKATIDLSTTAGLVELAKDVGAMRVRGGYLLGGVDSQGKLTGLLDGADPRPFDEANLVPKLLRYLSTPLELRTNVIERDGHKVLVICALPSPLGCTFCCADGMYTKDDKEVVVFRKGDVFWRDGTRSVRITQEGLEDVIRRRISTEKEAWIREQQEIRRRERAELEEAYGTRRLGEGPLGAVNLDLDTRELNLAALDLIRRDDTVALRHLLHDSLARARALVERDDVEDGIAELLDKLTCLAATFMAYGQQHWFEQLVALLVQIYSIPLAKGDARRFGYSAQIPTDETAPRVWLVVIERVYALGALAARLQDWESVRALTLQLPEPLIEDGYEANWLRHALTMASRAQQFEQRGDGQQVSLLSLARAVMGRLECLRPDGLSSEDDALLTSLAQFDVLSNVVAVGDAKTVEGRVFYSNFARFRQARMQRIVERLISDPQMRKTLFPMDDADLAIALNEIGRRARQEGVRYDGFQGWEGTAVDDFIRAHLPEPPSPQA